VVTVIFAAGAGAGACVGSGVAGGAVVAASALACGASEAAAGAGVAGAGVAGAGVGWLGVEAQPAKENANMVMESKRQSFFFIKLPPVRLK